MLLGVVWLFVPTSSSGSTTVLSDGTVIEESSRTTTLENEGAGVILVLAVPVLLAAIAVAVSQFRRARIVRFIAGGVLLAGCVLGAASIGLPYMPGAIALLVAAGTTPAQGATNAVNAADRGAGQPPTSARRQTG